MSPQGVVKKKSTGRYQLQFPIVWLRTVLRGRCAEEWRRLVLAAFRASSAPLQQQWRSQFDKKGLMSSTLTVENRSGRRFDRSALLREAQEIYGTLAVPASAPPKLLARCFQHSVDFALQHGLVAAPPPADSTTEALSTPPAEHTPSSSHSAAAGSIPDLPAAGYASEQDSSLSRQTSSTCQALAVSSPACPASPDPLYPSGGGSLTAELLASDSVLLGDLEDTDDWLAHLADDGALLSTGDVAMGNALEDAVMQPCAIEAVASDVCRHVASIEMHATASDQSTACAQSLQVGVGLAPAAAKVGSLQQELAAMRHDLAVAREQRDAAVLALQTAALREAQLQSDMDMMRLLMA